MLCTNTVQGQTRCLSESVSGASGRSNRVVVVEAAHPFSEEKIKKEVK